MDFILKKNEINTVVEGSAHSVSDPFVDRLVQTRKQLKLTQQNIADATGIDRGNIGRIESKKYVPTLEVLVKYAAAMGYSVDLNLTRKDNEQ